MNKKDIRNLQGQWVFVVLAGFLAIFLGITINALYDLLKNIYSIWWIAVFFGCLSFLFIDILTYFFDTVEEAKNNPEESYSNFLLRYVKMRLRKLRILK